MSSSSSSPLRVESSNFKVEACMRDQPRVHGPSLDHCLLSPSGHSSVRRVPSFPLLSPKPRGLPRRQKTSNRTQRYGSNAQRVPSGTSPAGARSASRSGIRGAGSTPISQFPPIFHPSFILAPYSAPSPSFRRRSGAQASDPATRTPLPPRGDLDAGPKKVAGSAGGVGGGPSPGLKLEIAGAPGLPEGLQQPGARHHHRHASNVSEGGYDAEQDPDSETDEAAAIADITQSPVQLEDYHTFSSALGGEGPPSGASTPTLSPRGSPQRPVKPPPSLTESATELDNLVHPNMSASQHGGSQRGGSSQHQQQPKLSLHHTHSFQHTVHHGSGPRPSNYLFPKRRSSSRGGVSRRQSMADVAASHPFPTPGVRSASFFGDYKSVEEERLQESEKKVRHWKRWGPYLSERQWATVREDYSANGDAWTHFPHDHARSRTYRWGEDGLGGVSDNHGRLCFSMALWNGVDPILKERLFGTTGHQGNHGEDVKELYYYLDSSPTHSYMRYLYKYPQRPYPYEQLIRESTNRSRDVGEFEITDTDAFDDNKYWDVFVEYAKDSDNENAMSIRIAAYNRGPEPATLHIVPQLWFRNTWSWGKERPRGRLLPSMHAVGDSTVAVDHKQLGRMYMHVQPSPAASEAAPRRGQVVEVEDEVKPELMFTENETNFERLYGGKNRSFAKDAFHDHIIPSHRPKPPKKEKPKTNGSTDEEAVNGNESPEPPSTSGESTPQPDRVFINPERRGTKAGAHYVFTDVPGNGGCAVVRLKLTTKTVDEDSSIQDEEKFDANIEERRQDADEFYARFNTSALSEDLRNIMRQALSGMLWTKQFYYFVQSEWIDGDPGQPPPPPERKWIRNRDWKHMYIEDVLSMPDKWEYPFFAAWDTAFHCLPLAMVDPAYAKNQLDIMTREWYMKPDGALPAYEWNFSDVNPPVHAWATFRVFKIERKMHGREDLAFLERVFQKLLLNFTWWVNRKDASGQNVFEGGFLGLDNIGAFNRSEPLPTGGVLRQADGTAWMAFFALNMLNMALELAKHNPVYEDIASKFFEHFLFISQAMTFGDPNDEQLSLWNDKDGFYYDAISWGPGNSRQLPVRSLVGLIPLYATLTLEPGVLKRFPGFKKRMDWFIENRPELASKNIANMRGVGRHDRKLLALASEERLKRILERMLDETEFLSDYGIRSLSRYHKENPYKIEVGGEEFGVDYWPGDSHSAMFGGNSNWRGPIWLATTQLLIESLQRFYQYYGASLQVECPKGSGDMMNLANVADEIQHRVLNLFARNREGRRPCNGGSDKLDFDPHFRDHVLFHEFFHADTGKGLGASHQTGWTGLCAIMIWQTGQSARLPRTPRTPRSAAEHYFAESIPPTPAASDFSDAPSDLYDNISASEMEPDEL